MNSKPRQGHKREKDPIICKCNEVPLSRIEEAIRGGADEMNKIFDATTAGVGACGGSCRKVIVPILEHYLKTKTFKRHE